VVDVSVDAPMASSDGGLVLIRQLDERLGFLPVRRVMGPLGGDFRRVMGPAHLQHDGATREGAVTLVSQGHGASYQEVFAASWGQPDASDLE
jgi:hypothetical protein